MALCGCAGKELQQPPERLESRGRRARLVASVVLASFTAAAALKGDILAAAVVGWFSFWHLAAAALAYPGCPELGLPLSCARRRRVFVHGAWCRYDRRGKSAR